VAQGRLRRAEINAAQARQIAQLGDQDLTAKLESAWGKIKTSSSEIKAAVRRVRGTLTPAALNAANLPAGRGLFEQRCATCHRLFDRGGAIGPDLTGSGRKDLEYLLQNIIDPNAVIPADFQLCVVTTQGGRTVSGTMAETERSVIVQTITERLTFDRADIKEVQRLPISLMPTGLLDSLTPDQTRDIVAYLMSDGIPAELSSDARPAPANGSRQKSKP
jgi:putative heme-binding domain-containing protein